MEDQDSAHIPDTVPVMVLGGATLFPHGYMPLFIFEQRYRGMLEFALERDRMFCIGHGRPGIDTDQDPDPVYPVSTVGLIRACVTHGDGTSHLMLSGLQRVEILGWEQAAPFRVATVVPQPSRVIDPSGAADRALEVVDLSSRLCGDGKPMSQQLREHLSCIKDPCAISDVVAQTFLSNPEERQHLLDTLSVEQRLDYLIEHLSTLLAQGQG